MILLVFITMIFVMTIVIVIATIISSIVSYNLASRQTAMQKAKSCILLLLEVWYLAWYDIL